MATAPQIRAIYALGSKLGINQNNREDNLHQLVYSITGKESIKGLTNYEAARVQSELANMERKVHAADIPPGKITAKLCKVFNIQTSEIKSLKCSIRRTHERCSKENYRYGYQSIL